MEVYRGMVRTAGRRAHGWAVIGEAAGSCGVDTRKLGPRWQAGVWERGVGLLVGIFLGGGVYWLLGGK